MIAIPKQHYKVEFLFPLVIFLLSIYNLAEQFSFSSINSILRIIVSLIGIIGAVLYFKSNKLYPTFIFIWSLAQLLVIEKVTEYPNTNTSFTQVVLDLTQGFRFDFAFTLGGNNTSTNITVNILSIIYLGLTKVLSLAALYGSEISISAFREETTLSNILPTKGIIENRVTLSKEKNWLLTKLQPKEGQIATVEYALIKPKDNSILKLKKNQVVYFLLVPDRNMIKEENNSRDDFPKGDWAVVS